MRLTDYDQIAAWLVSIDARLITIIDMLNRLTDERYPALPGEDDLRDITDRLEDIRVILLEYADWLNQASVEGEEEDHERQGDDACMG